MRPPRSGWLRNWFSAVEWDSGAALLRFPRWQLVRGAYWFGWFVSGFIKVSGIERVFDSLWSYELGPMRFANKRRDDQKKVGQ